MRSEYGQPRGHGLEQHTQAQGALHANAQTYRAKLPGEVAPEQRPAKKERLDIENVIQHIHPTGDKVAFDQRLGDLKRFFAAEGPSGLDFPGTRTQHQDGFQELMRQRGHADFVALNGDFGAWYDQTHAALMDEAPRGYPAMDNSDFGYALARDGRGDHPLFASSGNGFYKSVA